MRRNSTAQSVSLTITFDLEDNRRSVDQEERFARASDRFLDFIEQRQITATVFVVGELARSHPKLIRRVVSDGHEIGLHGLSHVALGDVGPQRLRNQLREGRDLLEDLAQMPILGFRAPIFSLTPSTSWAIEEILQAGFTYSSSVLPASNPLHGWPSAPREPFMWTNGLVELPCPVGGIGRARVPFLGGIYMRYVPRMHLRRLLDQMSPSAILWSYLHPYDLDADEEFFVLPHAGWLTSRVLHTRRAVTLERLDAVIAAADGPAPPLSVRVLELVRDQLPVIGPK